MKNILKVLGSTILTFAVVASLLAFILPNSETEILKGFGESVTSTETSFENYGDTKASIEYAALEKPEIQLKSGVNLKKDIVYTYENLFLISDSTDMILIKYIKKQEEDAEDLLCYDNETQQLEFIDSGRYVLKVSITNEENRTTESLIHLSVNR